MRNLSSNASGNSDGELRGLLGSVFALYRGDSCVHVRYRDDGMAGLQELRCSYPETQFKPACINVWLQDGRLRDLGHRLIVIAEEFPNLNSAAEECRGECRRVGLAAHDLFGLGGMMVLHDAMIAALGWKASGSQRTVDSASGNEPSTSELGWAPHALDSIWDGIGEWQKERGWHFIPGSPGRYEFGAPANWPYGYMPARNALEFETMHDPSTKAPGNTDNVLRRQLGSVCGSYRSDGCVVHGCSGDGMAIFENLRRSYPEAQFKRSCAYVWLRNDQLRKLGYRLIAIEEVYPDLNSTAEDCREECRRVGHAANDLCGLGGMMMLHDAMIAALGWKASGSQRFVRSASENEPSPIGSRYWAPHVLDFLWDGIGEWQKERGWHFIPGGPGGPGRYVFGAPANWPYGYMSSECSREPLVQQILLRLTTTETEEAGRSALLPLQYPENPFVVAASAWAVGQRQMEVAVPHLLPLLKHSSHIVRVYAAEALWKINGEPSEVLPTLVEVVASAAILEENKMVKWRAVRLIERMHQGDQAAMDVLEQFHRANDPKTGISLREKIDRVRSKDGF